MTNHETQTPSRHEQYHWLFNRDPQELKYPFNKTDFRCKSLSKKVLTPDLVCCKDDSIWHYDISLGSWIQPREKPKQEVSPLPVSDQRL